MVTPSISAGSATNVNSLAAQVIERLQAESSHLRALVMQELRSNVTEMTGPFSSMRQVPAFAEQIVGQYLDLLRERVSPQEARAQLRFWVQRGLSPEGAFAVSDVLYRAGVEQDITGALRPALDKYRREFVVGYQVERRNEILSEQERMQRSLTVALEKQIASERQARAALVRRQNQLEAVADLARVTGTIHEVQELLVAASGHLHERLNLAFVGIYLLDEFNQWAILRSGSGAVGTASLAHGYQLNVLGSPSLSNALEENLPLFFKDGLESQSGVQRLMPETRTAILIPLNVRGTPRGFWAAHSEQEDAFTEQDITVLTLVGDNLAYAIENAELLTRAQASMREMELAQRGYVRDSWESEALSAQVVYSQQQDSFAPRGADDVSELSVPPANDGASHDMLSVPIMLRGQLIGTVDLFDVTQPRHWDENEKALASGVVEQLALAVENARLYKETEQRARETQIINELAGAISGELDSHRLFETVYQYLPRLMPTDAFMVWLYDDQTHKVTRPALYDLGVFYPDEEGPREPSGTVALVVESLAPVAINNTRTAWERERQATQLILGSSEPSASRVYAPLRVGNRLRGIMSVQTYEFDAYGSPQMALLTGVANTVATSLENAQLFAETNRLFTQAQQALAETRLLYRTSGQLNQVSSLEELVRIAAQPAFAQGAGSAQLLLMDYRGQETPVAANVIVSLVSPGVAAPLSPYTHFAIDEYTLGLTMIANLRELVIVEDVVESTVLDEATRQVLLSSDERALVLMPLSVEQRVLGAIAIGWSAPHRFTEQERRIYQSLAGQLALVLNNRLLFEQTEQALAETQTLYEISARLNAANSLQESLEAASGPAIVQGASTASLYRILVEPDGNINTLQIAALWPRNSNRGVEIDQRFERQNIAGDQVWLENPHDPLLVENVQDDERVSAAAQHMYEANKIQASALLPLKIGDRWIGLLTFDWQEPHTFTPRDARLYRSIMAQAATVLDNRTLFDQAQFALAQVRQQNTYLTALHDTTLGLMRRLDRDELLQNIITRAGELVGTEHGYVYLIEPNGNELRMRVGNGIYRDFIGTIVKPGEGLAGTVWGNQEPIVVDDYRVWPQRLPMVDRDVLRAVAGVPLKSENQTVGVLGLASLEEGRRFGAAQIEALNRFAELAAVALDNAQLYDATQQALQQTRRVAQREKASSEIADKMYAAPDVKAVMRTAAEELRKSTGSRRAIVRLNLGPDRPTTQGNGKSEPGSKSEPNGM